LKSNKFRVFLTTLGIIVGAATIVLVMAIGEGGQAMVEEQFSMINADVITIMGDRRGTEQPDETILAYLEEHAENLVEGTVTISASATASFGSESTSASVMGIYPEFLDVNSFEMAYGDGIDDSDIDKRKKIVLLGSEIAEALFEDDPSAALGEEIKVNSRQFEVVGILEQSGKSIGFSSADEAMFFPYDTALKYIAGNEASPQLQLKAESVETTSALYDEVDLLLNQYFVDDGGHEFRIRDAGSMLTSAQDTASLLAVLLTSVAAIVLIVGGIGIMNVLFVSVKERTKEIGVLKAIGAKRNTILLIFLVESVVISAIGGAVGIVVGLAATPLVSMGSIPAIATPSGVLLAGVFSLITGTVFGFYPALSAAKLSPIDALRYE
jgi:putative ABC transport system permease protein